MECIPRKRTMNLLWAPYSFNTFSPSSLFYFAHSLCVWDDVSLCHIYKVRHNQHYSNVSTHSHPPPSTNSSNVTPQGMDVFFLPFHYPLPLHRPTLSGEPERKLWPRRLGMLSRNRYELLHLGKKNENVRQQESLVQPLLKTFFNK